MEGTPSPASDDVAIERCCCYESTLHPPPVVFLHAVPSRAEVSRAEPKHASC
jgi:hypothetical protein